MSWTTKVAFMFIIFLSSWMLQEQVQHHDTVRVLLKSAANKATHDAIQEVDYTTMQDGRIVFDPVRARAEFERSLGLNLGLDSSLMPNAKSAMSSQVKVLKFEIIDDSSGVTFPYVYEDVTFRLYKILRGPAIVAVIEVKTIPMSIYPSQTVKASSISEYTFHK